MSAQTSRISSPAPSEAIPPSESAVIGWSDRIAALLAQNRRLLAFSVVAILVGGVAIGVMRERNSQTQERAQAALGALQESFDKRPPLEMPKESAPEKESKAEKPLTREAWMTEVNDRLKTLEQTGHKGNAATLGLLYAANLAREQNDLGNAEKHYRLFLDQIDERSDLVNVARYALATVLEDKQSGDEALRFYKLVAGNEARTDLDKPLPTTSLPPGAMPKKRAMPKAPLVEQALWAVARMESRDASKQADLKATYERITREFAGTESEAKARARLTEMSATAKKP